MSRLQVAQVVIPAVDDSDDVIKRRILIRRRAGIRISREPAYLTDIVVALKNSLAMSAVESSAALPSLGNRIGKVFPLLALSAPAVILSSHSFEKRCPALHMLCGEVT